MHISLVVCEGCRGYPLYAPIIPLPLKVQSYLMSIWRPPSLSELTPIMFNMKLTQLGSETSILKFKLYTFLTCLIIKGTFSLSLSKQKCSSHITVDAKRKRV